MQLLDSSLPMGHVYKYVLGLKSTRVDDITLELSKIFLKMDS